MRRARRFIYLCYEHPVLTQTFTAGEIAGLREEGLSPEVVSCRPAAGGPGRGIVYLPPPLCPRVIGAARAQAARRPGACIRLLRALGAARYRDEAGRCLLRGMLQFLWGCHLAAEADRAGTPAHWHAQFLDAASTVALTASMLRGDSFSFTNHTAYNPYLPGEKLARATVAFSISEYDRTDLRRHLRPGHDDPVRVAYQGIDTAFWGGERARGGAACRIVSVGALREKKGHHVLLRAVAAIRSAGREVSVRIVGDGPERGRLLRLRGALGLDASVTFEGAARPEEVRAALRGADVFVLACLRARNGDLDGIPVSLMEAMAAGVPVVSTRLSGIPELVGDGQEGLLAAPGDAGDLARCLERVLVDREAAEGMARRAAAKVRRQHERRACVARVAESLRPVLG